MSHRVLSVLITLLLSSATAQAASAPPPERIAASIYQHGAETTVAALLKTDRWEGVAERMGSGDARWIALAPQLAPGADGAVAEGLGISLAYSLPKNPRAVLAALDLTNGPVIGAGQVCSIPFIEDTVRNRPAYRRRALRAVVGVRDPSLRRARAACLAELRRSG